MESRRRPKLFRFQKPKKETPRKRIMRLREQIRNLYYQYGIGKPEPSLCHFCRSYWFDKYIEGDFDYGCYVREDQNSGDKVRCSDFAPLPDWELRAERDLVRTLYDSLRLLNPESKTLLDLKHQITDMVNNLKDTQNKYLIAVKDLAETESKLFNSKTKLEVLERMTK